MTFEPKPGMRINLNNETIEFISLESSGPAKVFVYAEAGKEGIIYKLLKGGEYYALKVFYPDYQDERLLKNTEKLSQFKHLEGFRVAERIVINPKSYPEVVNEFPELNYSVLMPWIQGTVWGNLMVNDRPLRSEKYLKIAQELIKAVHNLEAQGLAHCDLSNNNFIIDPAHSSIELIDIEDMFAPDMPRPIPHISYGTPGYRTKWIADKGLWSPNSDRFGLAILCAEIITWHNKEIRDNKAGNTSYFDEIEIGTDCERYRLMKTYLSRMSDDLSNLFEKAWFSENSDQCPLISDWMNVVNNLDASKIKVDEIDMIYDAPLEGSTVIKDGIPHIPPPKIELSNSMLDFGVLQKSNNDLQIVIANTGGSVLTGRFILSPWVETSSNRFSIRPGEKEKITVSINSGYPKPQTGLGYRAPNALVVESNAGVEIIGARYKLKKPIYYKTWLGVLIICVLGIIIFSLASERNFYQKNINLTATADANNMQATATKQAQNLFETATQLEQFSRATSTKQAQSAATTSTALAKISTSVAAQAAETATSRAIGDQITSIDLVVHYVEGSPAENEIAYDVNIYLSIVDSTGNPIKDLTTDSLTVTEDSQKVEITSLDLASEEPISIVLVMDTSGSMSGTGATAAKIAASNFISRMGNDDRVAIVTFDNTVKTKINFTTDHIAALNQISLIEVVRGAGTCLYDAAYQAIQMASTLPSGQRAVILFTDGVDETSSGVVCSTHTTEDVINIASEGGTRTPIYTLGMGSRIDTNTLKRLAELTGGRYSNSPDSSQLDAVFLRLSDQLRSQYILKYESVAGPGAHTLAVSSNYLNAHDTDTRNFLLPAMYTRIAFTSPLEGEVVSGIMKIAVSLSGQGETVDRVAFGINGEVVGTDATTPYELEIDLNPYSTGKLTLSAIAYGSTNTELTRKSITVEHAKADTGIENLPSLTNSDKLFRIVEVSIGGLVLITIVILAFFIIRRIRKGKTGDAASVNAKSNKLGGDHTVDSWELSADAFGQLIVEGSDDLTMIGHRFEINSSLTTLGRSSDNDITLPKDSPVSRHHAEIFKKGSGLYLREVESKGSSGKSKPPTFGTFINESPIGSDPVLLQTGDVIRLGKRMRLKFEASLSTSDTQSITHDGLLSSDDEKTQHEY